jgi:hypothetical protein
VDSIISTPSFTVNTTAISGLKWVDFYNHNLSATHLLLTSSIHQHLLTAQSVIFLIGTNSVRYTSAETIISQIQHFINTLRQQYPHLSGHNNITIIHCFPCLKPILPLFTHATLINNINQYNTQLINLSLSLNFRTIDFNVKDFLLGPDKMHINLKYKRFVQTALLDYLQCLTSVLTITCVKNHDRSREAKTRRNKLRHQKQHQHQKQLCLVRPIHTHWTLRNVKNFLRQQKIKFAKIPPIFKQLLRIHFNNVQDLQTAEDILPQNCFLS